MDSEDTHGGAEEEDEEERSDNDNDFRAEEQEEGLDNGGVDDAYAEAQEAMTSGTRMTCVCLFVCVCVCMCIRTHMLCRAVFVASLNWRYYCAPPPV